MRNNRTANVLIWKSDEMFGPLLQMWSADWFVSADICNS